VSQESAPGDPAGLSLRGFFLAGIRLAHNRLLILSTEVAEEKVRLTLLAVAALGALFFVGLTIVLGAILLVVLYWETHRVQLLTAFTLFSGLLAVLLVWIAAKALAMRQTPFSATLQELKKDEDAWRAAADDR
jgi:uncharacterized membrane protein YqjE